MKSYIDWDKTAVNLKLLRQDNLELRRYVCRELNYGKADCHGDCPECKYDMDTSISQAELGKVFGVTAGVIANWETARTTPSLDDLMFYSEICKLKLFDVVILIDNRRGL